MELYLSKLIPLFLYPLGLAIVLLIATLAILSKWPGVARAFLWISAGLLWVLSTPITSDHLCSFLEWRYLPVRVEQTPSADAIVVLGGAVAGPAPPRFTLEMYDAADRVLHAMRLYRAGKARFILVSGGGIPWRGTDSPEAETMRELLEEWGIPKSAILVESSSQNTHENAVFTKQVLAHNRLSHILLVTSALHMPRALATFRSAGINATPAPADFTVVYGEHSSIFDFLPNAASLSHTTDAIKEYFGYAYYLRKRWIQS